MQLCRLDLRCFCCGLLLISTLFCLKLFLSLVWMIIDRSAFSWYVCGGGHDFSAVFGGVDPDFYHHGLLNRVDAGWCGSV